MLHWQGVGLSVLYGTHREIFFGHVGVWIYLIFHLITSPYGFLRTRSRKGIGFPGKGNPNLTLLVCGYPVLF
jgi:hypothetical protein